jgi:hypothetical protein
VLLGLRLSSQLKQAVSPKPGIGPLGAASLPIDDDCCRETRGLVKRLDRRHSALPVAVRHARNMSQCDKNATLGSLIRFGADSNCDNVVDVRVCSTELSYCLVCLTTVKRP